MKGEKTRNEIFGMFLINQKLKFNEIEKKLKIRSNMVSYHLDCMIKEGLLKKSGLFYCLTEKGEQNVPIFSHISGKELSPLAVVLVAVNTKEKTLLIKRTKRPYRNYLSMIGGKMLLHEDIISCAERLALTKAGIKGKFNKIHALIHEQVIENEKVKHSFLLFFVSINVKTMKIKSGEHGELKWFSKYKLNPNEIIPSDYWLLKNKLNDELKLKNVTMKEKEGKISEFKIK